MNIGRSLFPFISSFDFVVGIVYLDRAFFPLVLFDLLEPHLLPLSLQLPLDIELPLLFIDGSISEL